MIGILIDTKSYVQAVDFKDDLTCFHSLLDCRCIDCVKIRIDGMVFDAVCDDEGLLKDNPIPAVVDARGNIVLVGKVLITKASKDSFKGLNGYERSVVMNRIRPMLDSHGFYHEVVMSDAM